MRVTCSLRLPLGGLCGVLLAACAGAPASRFTSAEVAIDAGPPSRGDHARGDQESHGEAATAHAALPAAPAAVAASARDVWEQPTVDAVCLGTIDAFAALADAETALQALATRQNIRLGGLRFVRLDSDPGARPRRSTPRLCASVVDAAVVYAPLFREREASSSWLIERGLMSADTALGEVALRLANRAATAGRASLGPVRALVEDGALVGLALPVAPATDR